MTTMEAVDSPSILHAEFVRLTVGKEETVYTFCNAAAPIVVDGITFSNLGALLSVGEIQQEMKATSSDMTIALTGIDPANIAIILSNEIKGSIVEVWRGFFDSNNQILTSPSTQFFKRYQGIINSVAITEDFSIEARTRIATCVISCSSMRQVLLNRLSGVKTNLNSWQYIYPGDLSMNRVSEITATYFDFGGQPQMATQSATFSDMPNPNI